MAQPMKDSDRGIALPTLTGAANGTIKRVERFHNKIVHFTGAFTGGWSLVLQGSLDGSTWVAIGSAVTAATLVDPNSVPAVDFAWKYYRLYATTIGNANAVSVVMGGFSD